MTLLLLLFVLCKGQVNLTFSKKNAQVFHFHIDIKYLSIRVDYLPNEKLVSLLCAQFAVIDEVWQGWCAANRPCRWSLSRLALAVI